MPKIFSINSNDFDDIWSASYYESKAQVDSCLENASFSFQQLDDIAFTISGKYIPEYVTSGVPYLRVDNIRNIIGNFSNGDVAFITQENADSISEKTRCRINDIIISRTGTIGKAMLTTKHHIGIALSQHLTIIRTESFVKPGYLCLFLNSPLGYNQLIGSASGSTRLELNHSNLRKIRIPIVATQDQEYFDGKIQSLLDEYYDLQKDVENLVKETNEILDVQLDFSDLNMNTFTCNNLSIFSIDDYKMDDLWNPKRYIPIVLDTLNYLTENFECVNLNTISIIERGKGTRSADYQKDGKPFIRTSSIINNSLDPFPDHYASDEVYLNYNQPIVDGDILFTMEGKIGQVAMLNSNLQIVFKNHIERIRINKIIKPFSREQFMGWIYLVLLSNFSRIQCFKHTVIQATIPGLSSRLRDFIIPIGSKTDSNKTQKILALGEKSYTMMSNITNNILALHSIQNEFNNYILNILID